MQRSSSALPLCCLATGTKLKQSSEGTAKYLAVVAASWAGLSPPCNREQEGDENPLGSILQMAPAFVVGLCKGERSTRIMLSALLKCTRTSRSVSKMNHAPKMMGVDAGLYPRPQFYAAFSKARRGIHSWYASLAAALGLCQP